MGARSDIATIATLVPRDGASTFDRPVALSKAKLTPPRAPAQVIAADRYRQWLQPVLTHDVTLVCAAVRYGKTVFAAELYRETVKAGLAAGWVSCAGAPSNRIADYVRSALEALNAEEQPKHDYVVSPATRAVDLANRVHDHDGSVLLCLDDVDQVADAEGRDFLLQLVNNCPTNLHILMTCRDEDGVLPGLMESRGVIQRLTAQVLRARDAEVAEYLASEGIRMSSRRVRALNEMLGGWWGALRRAVASLRSGGWRASPDDWRRLCVQWVAPLFRETLQDMPEQHRALLTRCAVAKTLTPDLAIHLSGDETAATVLRDIARQEQFVGLVPGRADEYAIHPALRAALLADARELQSGTVEDLRARAIDWHVQRGELDQAIAIAMDGANVAVQADTLARLGMDAIQVSGPYRVREAIDRLPRGMVAQDKPLSRIALWSMALSGSDLSTPHGVPLAIDAEEGAMLQQIRAAARGSNIVNPLTIVPSNRDFGSRLLVALSADAFLRTGEHRQVPTMLRPIIRHGRAAGIGFAEAIALVTMADLHRAQGRPADAEQLLQESLTGLALGAGQRSSTAALLAVALADAHYLRNDLTTATPLIDEFLPIITSVAPPGLLVRGYRVAIRVTAASGRSQEALALIEAAEETGADRGLPLLTALGAVERLRLHIPLITSLDEILPPAAEEAAVAAPGSVQARTFALLAEARAREAIADLDRSRLTLVANRLLELAERTEDVELRVIGTLLHVLPQLGGKCDRMIEIDTVRFLNRAAGVGFARSILDLLEITGVRTSEDFNRANYSAGSFLALLRLSRPAEVERGKSNQVSGSAFSFFTSREMEILRALGEGETNKMIARKLGVTPETIKWYMKSLMRKLRASSRDEIVNNAFVLGISFDRNDR